jgi:hypothetical protein
MIVLCVAGPEAVCRELLARVGDTPGAQDGVALFRLWHGGILLALGSLILATSFFGVAAHVAGDNHRRELEVKALASRLPPGQVVASTDWQSGLVFTFWNHGRYLGAPLPGSSESMISELRPLGPCLFLVWNQPNLARSVAAHPAFKRADLGSASVAVFEFKPTPQN